MHSVISYSISLNSIHTSVVLRYSSLTKHASHLSYQEFIIQETRHNIPTVLATVGISKKPALSPDQKE